jgi:hypothetical protein
MGGHAAHEHQSGGDGQTSAGANDNGVSEDGTRKDDV